MKRVARINTRWIEAEYEPIWINMETGRVIMTAGECYACRYATAEDGLADQNRIYPFEYIEVL